MEYIKHYELFMTIKPEDRLSGAAVFCENKILLVKPLKYKSKYNGWSFPKGRIENGLDVIQTALIEAKEEAGVDLVAEDSIFTFTVKYRKNSNRKELTLFGFEIAPEYLKPLLSIKGKIRKELYHRDEIWDVNFFSFNEAIKLIEPVMKDALVQSFAHKNNTK